MIELESAVDNQPPGPARKSVLAERLDLAVAWIATAVVGAVAISVVSSERPMLRMSGPIIAMACFLAFALTRSRFSTAKVADSVYFMGFLWTLWALIDLLIVGKKQLSSKDLYHAFGYSLTATAAGMFSRLAILQFFRTLDDQEDQAVDSIDERMRVLVHQLELSSVAVANIRGEAAATLAKWQVDLAAQAKRHLATIAQLATDFESEGKGLTDAVKAVRSSVAATSRTFSDLEKKTTASALAISQQLGGATTALESSVRDLSVRVAAIKIPDDLLTGAVQSAIQDTRGAATALRDLAVSTLTEMRASVEKLATELTKLPGSEAVDQAVKSSIAKLSNLAESCTQLSTQLGVVSASLNGVQQAIKGTQETAKKAGDDLTGSVRQVLLGLDDAHASVQVVNSNANRAAETLNEVVTFVNRQLAN